MPGLHQQGIRSLLLMMREMRPRAWASRLESVQESIFGNSEVPSTALDLCQTPLFIECPHRQRGHPDGRDVSQGSQICVAKQNLLGHTHLGIPSPQRAWVEQAGHPAFQRSSPTSHASQHHCITSLPPHPIATLNSTAVT